MKLRRCFPPVWACAALALAVRAGTAEARAAGPSLADAWQTLSTGFYDDAIRQFAATGNSREAQLGIAMAQFNRPPVTSSSLDDARAQFERLAAGNDASGRAARYFLGRLQQLHPMAPDPTAAARTFERLVATGADDRWCRLALVKLAVLRLTVLPSAHGPAAQLAGAEPLLARTADPVTRRDLHLVISEARMHHQLYDAITLGHLQSALGEPTVPADLRADLLIQIAQVARRLGDHGTARAHYERYLREFPKDRRFYTVQQALAHLGGPFPP
jgi:hypothetical protein